MAVILNKQNLTDILYGCTILGTGGGGDLSEGFNYIEQALAAGKEFKLLDINDVPAGEVLCTPYMLGAISELPPEQEKLYQGLPSNNEPAIITAYKRLEKYMDCSFYGTICCEMGGANTAISFYVAAMAGGYIIDADPAGRAVPEITHSTYYFNDLPAAPIVASNQFGECFICENVKDDQRAETLVRALAKVSRNDIAAIDHALPVEQLKGAVIEGTISKAMALGEAYRLAKAQGDDIAEAIAKKGGGKVVFRGKTRSFDCRTEEGFTVGYVDISGEDEYQGGNYHIDIKNENMYATLDGVVQVTIPDLICLIDMDSQEPVTNPNHTVGMNVAVVILPAPKEFTGERGLAAFGPAYVGLDCDYIPAISSISE